MTHTAHTPASPKSTLPLPADAADLDERAVRARTEAMAVTAFGTSVYEVASQSGNSYLVDVRAGRCTCPDHVIRGARCKHLRRVAIEITEGRVPPPGYVAADCDACGAETFVPRDATGPVRCRRHRLAPGDRVRDRETGDLLVVVGVSERRADEVLVPDTDRTVADYPTNEGYDPAAPVVAAVYPRARVDADGPTPGTLRVYSFPISRLDPVSEAAGRDAEAAAVEGN